MVQKRKTLRIRICFQIWVQRLQQENRIPFVLLLYAFKGTIVGGYVLNEWSQFTIATIIISSSHQLKKPLWYNGVSSWGRAGWKHSLVNLFVYCIMNWCISWNKSFFICFYVGKTANWWSNTCFHPKIISIFDSHLKRKWQTIYIAKVWQEDTNNIVFFFY